MKNKPPLDATAYNQFVILKSGKQVSERESSLE